MIWIFYIDWQQYCKCDSTMNIGAPECTWQTNSINKTTTSERLDSWASRLWRGIELVFKSLHCFTLRPFFSTRPITRMKSFSFLCVCVCVCVCGGGGGGGGGGGCRVVSSNAFTTWFCILISRPPRVMRRFKRRSCIFCSGGTTAGVISWGKPPA